MIHNKTWYPLCSLKEPIGWYPKSMKKYNFTGELNNLPDEIIDKLVERQMQAGNPSNASLFDGDCTINHTEGGFDWNTTIEGDEFWEKVLTKRDFNLFFERYPKSIKKYNFTGELTGFPDEIIDKLVERQIAAGNQPNASLFDERRSKDRHQGGFTWMISPEGQSFWCGVLNARNFDMFFEKYPSIPTKSVSKTVNASPMRTITPAQAQEIIDSACKEWKQTLFNKWGKYDVFKDSINISDDFYKEMRKACTGPQHLLFDKIFGKDEEFAVGELVLCSHLGTMNSWSIRTYTGNGTCTSHGVSGSENFTWKYIRKLPEGFKLPTI